jgi:hypothetical protein
MPRAFNLAQRSDNRRRTLRRKYFERPSAIEETLAASKPMEGGRRAIESKEPREDVVQIENAAAHLGWDGPVSPVPTPHIARPNVQQEGHRTGPERAPESPKQRHNVTERFRVPRRFNDENGNDPVPI